MGSPPITNPDVYLYSDANKNKVKSSRKVGTKKGRGKSKYNPTPADKARITGATKVA